MFKLVSTLFLAFLVASCSQKKAVKKLDGPKNPGSNIKQEQQYVQNNPIGSSISDQGGFIQAEYNLSTKIMGFIEPCKGRAKLDIAKDLGKSNAKLLTASGTMQCFGKTIDLSQVMSGLNGQSAVPPVIENGIINLRQMGQTTYSPYRPFLPSFLSADPEVLEYLDERTSDIYLENKASGETGTGSIHMQTLAWQQPYQSPDNPFEFKNTLRYSTEIDGFNTVKDKMSNMLFKKIEMVISLDPPAIPYIYFQGKAMDAMKAMQNKTSSDGAPNIMDMLSQGGGAIGAISQLLLAVMNIEITFDLIDQQGLSEYQDLLDDGVDSDDEDIF